MVTGDHADPANSQDLTNDYGKILRMTPGGGVPVDNPFPGSRIWAYGIRNSAGFGFDPITSEVWETDNAQEINDELNRIIKGRSYGWGPTQTCATPSQHQSRRSVLGAPQRATSMTDTTAHFLRRTMLT